jgi:hypothetical protein
MDDGELHSHVQLFKNKLNLLMDFRNLFVIVIDYPAIYNSGKDHSVL